MIDSITAEIIARKYYEDIYSYCLSYLCCDSDGASDVSQEVFLLFQEKCDTLENSNIKAWLYKTAKNKIHEHFRKIEQSKKFVELDETMLTVSEDELFSALDDFFTVDDEEIEKYKTAVLKILSENERLLYNKVFIEKKKYKEIAEEMNISEKAVNLRTLRLRNKIKKTVNLMFTSAGQIIIGLFF